jgi:hypothetical protein
MNPEEKAKEIVAHFMEYTPDYLVPDNKDAYTLCVAHALITGNMILDITFDKSYWASVIDNIRELDQRATIGEQP